jgi:hypothetical protein
MKSALESSKIVRSTDRLLLGRCLRERLRKFWNVWNCEQDQFPRQVATKSLAASNGSSPAGGAGNR